MEVKTNVIAEQVETTPERTEIEIVDGFWGSSASILMAWEPRNKDSNHYCFVIKDKSGRARFTFEKEAWLKIEELIKNGKFLECPEIERG